MAKILLIDDMVSVRAAIKSILVREGHDVVEAEDGQQGISIAQKNSLDLVITDIMMPVSDGVDVILTLKNHFKSLPVIAMSGGSSQIPADAALMVAREKADVCLTKPFENEELLQALDRLL